MVILAESEGHTQPYARLTPRSERAVDFESFLFCGLPSLSPAHCKTMRVFTFPNNGESGNDSASLPVYPL